MKNSALLILSILTLFPATLFSITALPIKLAVEVNDTADVCPVFKNLAGASSVTVSVLTQPVHGTLSQIPGKNANNRPALCNWVRYLPASNFTGLDRIQFNLMEKMRMATDWARGFICYGAGSENRC